MKKGTYRHSEETKRKIGDALRGRPCPPRIAARAREFMLSDRNPFRGKPQSAEHRARISEAMMGNKNRLGHFPSQETRIKLSESGKKRPGKRPSDETRAKMSMSHLGKHPTEETRKKMCDAQSGERNPSWGKHPSDEVRARMSKAHLGKHPSPEALAKIRGRVLRGELNPMWGKRLSAETCAKISESLRGRNFSPETRSKLSAACRRLWRDPVYVEHATRVLLKATQVRPTSPERRMRDILDRNFPDEWKYVGNGEVIIGGKNPDFVNVNGRKAVVEVFGDYWHSERITGKPAEQEVADRIAHFAKYGFRCTVIWEREVSDENLVLTKLGESA